MQVYQMISRIPPPKVWNIHFFLFYMNCKEIFFIPFLMKLGQLFLSLTQLSPSLLLNFLRKLLRKRKKHFMHENGEKWTYQVWHFYLNFLCLWFKLFHKLFLLLNITSKTVNLLFQILCYYSHLILNIANKKKYC